MNYEQQGAKSSQTSVFVKFYWNIPHPIYVLSVVAFYYSVELGSVTETIWPAKSEVFTVAL